MRVQVSAGGARRPRNERGAAAIMIALLMTSLCVLAAFITDFGTAYTDKRILQNGVDAGALGVAQHIAATAEPGATCDELKYDEETYRSDPATSFDLDVLFAANGAAQGGSITEYDIYCGGPTGDMVMVRVAGAETSPNFFGGVAGPEHTDGIDLTASATAAVGPAKSVVGLRPIAICQYYADMLMAEPETSHNVIYSVGGAKTPGEPCETAPGAWGLLDLDGAKGGGTNDVEDRLSGGFNESVGLAEDVFEGGCPEEAECLLSEQGAAGASLDEAMTDLLAEESFVVPVYDEVVKDGGNVLYHITGFLSLQLCGWDFTKKSPADTPNPTGACWDQYADPDPGGDSWMQVQFKGSVTIGEIDMSGGCGLGTDCDRGARVFKLAE